ncbi:amino acid permease [Sphingorhabdus sp.]|uniref:amino acid permease n=2 Tax=Sphingorhabdus sp. TaxID=1902408 RepID=UPI003C73D24D
MTDIAHSVASDISGGAELSRSLKSRHVSMIAIGGIIGAGLFVGSSTTIHAAGPAAVFSFAIAGFIILLVMRMLSEMAIALEGVQTFPDFARAGLGHLPGFLSGWLYWYFWVVVVAIEAIAGAQIIHGWFPGIPELAIGIALMAVLTAVNLMSARAYGEFEFWFSSIKVAAIIVFILLCAAWAFGFTSGSGATFINLTQHGGFVPNGWGVVIAAATSTIFSLVGAEIATIAAAESEEPAKVISKMTVSVTLRILIFYILSILLIVAVVPWTEIVPKQSPFAATLGFMGVPGGKLIMEAVVLVAVLSCLNSGMYVTSRALFGLAKHNDAPQWLVQVNARKVPARAILIGSLFSYFALAADAVSRDVVFSFLINSCGVTMLLLYLMTAGAQLKLRRKFEADAPERLQIKMWFHPFGTYVAMAAMLGILVAKGMDQGASQELWLSLLVALAFVGGFFVFRRGKSSAA